MRWLENSQDFWGQKWCRCTTMHLLLSICIPIFYGVAGTSFYFRSPNSSMEQKLTSSIIQTRWLTPAGVSNVARGLQTIPVVWLLLVVKMLNWVYNNGPTQSAGSTAAILVHVVNTPSCAESCDSLILPEIWALSDKFLQYLTNNLTLSLGNSGNIPR